MSRKKTDAIEISTLRMSIVVFRKEDIVEVLIFVDRTTGRRKGKIRTYYNTYECFPYVADEVTKLLGWKIKEIE